MIIEWISLEEAIKMYGLSEEEAEVVRVEYEKYLGDFEDFKINLSK